MNGIKDHLVCWVRLWARNRGRFEGRSFEDWKGEVSKIRREKIRRFEGEGPKGLRKEGWVKDKKGPHSLS